MYKISFIIMVFRGDGIDKIITSIANHLDKKLYTVNIAAGASDGDTMGQLDPEITFTNLHTTSIIPLFFSLVGYLRREKPDIIISAGAHLNVVSVVANIVSGIRAKNIVKETNTFSLLASTARNAKNRFMARFILPFFVAFFYPKADAMVSVSEGVAKDLLVRFPNLKKEKMHVIYNPLNHVLISRLSKEPVSHPWFAGSHEPIILAVARLVRAKDYQTLFRAFALALKEKPCKLVILGEGEERRALKIYADKIAISEHLVFMGFVKNPFKYMAKSSVFVLSSKEEGFGAVLVEAMQCGVPVISTACAGPIDIIENNKNGILVPIGDEVSMAKTILRVLGDNYLMETMSKEGKKRAQDFTVSKTTATYEKLFHELLT